MYKADLLPCGPAGSEGGEPALPRTRLYSEMVTKSYIQFRDTDLVGEGWGGPGHERDLEGGVWAAGIGWVRRCHSDVAERARAGCPESNPVGQSCWGALGSALLGSSSRCPSLWATPRMTHIPWPSITHPVCSPGAARATVRGRAATLARGRRCRRSTAPLQELPRPGAHAQDALAGGESRAEPRPPAAGGPAQGES